MIVRLPVLFEIPDERFRLIDWKIVVGCLKGGVAKSTSAWLLAVEIYRRTGEKVLLVCADPNSQTILNAARRLLGASAGADLPFHVIPWHTHEGLANGVLNEMRRLGCRHFVIDVGGGDMPIFQAACTIGEELIVPAPTNIIELERLEPTLVAANQVGAINEITPNIVLVKVTHKSVKATRAYEWLVSKGWPVMETRIPRQAFYEDFWENDCAPSDGGFYGSVLAEIALDKLADDD